MEKKELKQMIQGFVEEKKPTKMSRRVAQKKKKARNKYTVDVPGKELSTEVTTEVLDNGKMIVSFDSAIDLEDTPTISELAPELSKIVEAEDES
jgi:hypothetical protein